MKFQLTDMQYNYYEESLIEQIWKTFWNNCIQY